MGPDSPLPAKGVAGEADARACSAIGAALAPTSCHSGRFISRFNSLHGVSGVVKAINPRSGVALGLPHQLLNHLAVADDLDRPAGGGLILLVMVDTQEMIEGGRHVFGGDG